MGRKITLKLKLDAEAVAWLDEWRPLAPPSFPIPSREDKVMLAVYGALARIETFHHFNEECGDAISRMWGWTPPCVNDAKKRMRKMRKRQRKRLGSG